MPLECTLGESCFIQQYVDRDPSPLAQDFSCGPLSYDGHKGTDFALNSLADMQKGINVLAAAAGVVSATRDGEPDLGMDGMTAGKECGNGLSIDHGDGWVTQYCHMKAGSLMVSAGETVSEGQVLGQVGLSGRTQFPHLHMSLRRNDRVIDPFAPDTQSACNASSEGSLWKADIPYQPGGIIAIGLADKVPQYDQIKAGSAALPELVADQPAMVIFVYAFGVREGDTVDLQLKGPSGVIAEQKVALSRTQAQAFRAVGKKRKGQAWPAGTYTGRAALVRNGETIDQSDLSMTLK